MYFAREEMTANKVFQLAMAILNKLYEYPSIKDDMHKLHHSYITYYAKFYTRFTG